MTGAVIADKVSGRCTYSGCDEPCSDSSCMCTVHAADAAARVRRSTTKLRAQRRAAGQCVACEKPSRAYRCADGCERRQPELPL